MSRFRGFGHEKTPEMLNSQGFRISLVLDQRLLNSLISSETARHFRKSPRKLRWFCVFRSVLLDSGGFCKQRSWSPVSAQPPYGVRICCMCASYPPHPRAMDFSTIYADPHFNFHFLRTCRMDILQNTLAVNMLHRHRLNLFCPYAGDCQSAW